MVAARVTTEQFSVTPTSVRLGVYLFRSRTPQRQPDTAPLRPVRSAAACAFASARMFPASASACRRKLSAPAKRTWCGGQLVFRFGAGLGLGLGLGIRLGLGLGTLRYRDAHRCDTLLRHRGARASRGPRRVVASRWRVRPRSCTAGAGPPRHGRWPQRSRSAEPRGH